MAHDPQKQLEALAELIVRLSAKHAEPLTMEQAMTAARAVLSTFDLAGKGTLDAFKAWVLEMYAAGPYMDEGGSTEQAVNCAAGICC